MRRAIIVFACTTIVGGGCASKSPVAGEFNDPLDGIRLAAYEHAFTSMLQPDTSGVRPLCFSLYPEDRSGTPPRGPEVDPSEEIMQRLRGRFAAARRRSECAARDNSIPPRGPNRADRPIYYHVGLVRLRNAHEAEVSMGVFVHMLHAGGSLCTATLASGRWSVMRCSRTWES